MATDSLTGGWWSTLGLGSNETVDIAKSKERQSLSPRSAPRRPSSEVAEPSKSRSSKSRSPPPLPPARVRTPPPVEAVAAGAAVVPPSRGQSPPASKVGPKLSPSSTLSRISGADKTESVGTSIGPILPPPATGSLRSDRAHTPPSSGEGRLARRRPAPLGVNKTHHGREFGRVRSESPPHSPPMKGVAPSVGPHELEDGMKLRPRAVTGTERLRRMIGFRKSKTPPRGGGTLRSASSRSSGGNGNAEGVMNPVGRILMNNPLVNRAAVFLANGNTKAVDVNKLYKESQTDDVHRNSAGNEKEGGEDRSDALVNKQAQQRGAERAAKAATAMAQWEWLGRPEVLPAQLKQDGLLDDRHQRRSVRCVVWHPPNSSARVKFALKVRG